jgi:copper chaperone NosL
VRRGLIWSAALLIGWAAICFAQAGAVLLAPKPGPKDLCPVCGMLVSKYPNWLAIVVYDDGHAHFFDGAKDMFKYLQALPRYAPGRQPERIAAIWATDYYNLARVDARKAYYVSGSNVLGPMGHELVPLASRADAEEFLKEHNGKRLLRFDQITREVIDEVEKGRS